MARTRGGGRRLPAHRSPYKLAPVPGWGSAGAAACGAAQLRAVQRSAAARDAAGAAYRAAISSLSPGPALGPAPAINKRRAGLARRRRRRGSRGRSAARDAEQAHDAGAARTARVAGVPQLQRSVGGGGPANAAHKGIRGSPLASVQPRGRVPPWIHDRGRAGAACGGARTVARVHVRGRNGAAPQSLHSSPPWHSNADAGLRGVDGAGIGVEAARAGAAVAGARGRGFELPASSPSVLGSPSAEVPPRGTYDSDGRWIVESLALGDNTVDKNGLAMAGRVFHASAQGHACHEGYHPVDWDASIFRNTRGGALKLPTRVIATRCDGPTCVVPEGRELRRSRAEVVAGHVRAFLQRRPGLAVIIAGIAARERVSWPESDRRHVPGQPVLTSVTHDCVRAALVNAVFAATDGDAARRVRALVERDVRLWRSLKPLSLLLDEAKASVIRCRIVRNAELQRAVQCSERHVAFEAIAAKCEGVFLVRLREDARVDHAVVVDANNGVIIDSEETFALALSAEILERCGGDDAKRLRVCEVREVKALE